MGTSTADEIRYGFIGVGMMGQEHLRNVQALPGARVAAIADPHGPSLAGAQATLDAAVPAYEDPADMLRRESLDAVVVATPNHTHRHVLEPLWGTGVHLMVEKPLCTTVEDCLAVRDAAADHDGVVWVGLEYRYMPPVQRFLAESRSPGIGRVRMVSIREHRFPFLTKVGDWNRFSAQHRRHAGGEVLPLLRPDAPGPARRTAGARAGIGRAGREPPRRGLRRGVPDILDNAFVIVDFDDASRALLDLSMFAEGSAYEQELVAVGDAGKVEVRLPGFMELARGRRAQLVVGSRGDDWPVMVSELGEDERVRHVGAHHGASYLEHVDFCAAIREGTRATVTVDDGLWSVAMGAAAHRSIDEGRPVTLAEMGLPAELLGP